MARKARTRDAFAYEANLLDETNLRLLHELRAEGRIGMAELGRRIGMSAPAVAERVQRLERAGVISGYRATLDRERLGLGLTVFVDLKVDNHSERTAAGISEAMAKAPEVVAAHVVSGSADLLLEVVVPDVAAYERLLFETLLTLPHVVDARSNFALRTVKTPGPLPV